MWVDALYEKVRVDNRVESMVVVIATGVNPPGRREVLGFDVIPAESEEGWTAFFKSLKERGLSGVALVVPEGHGGLKAAVRQVLKAKGQGCKVHFYRNVLVHVSKRSQAEVSEAMKAVFVQRDENSAKAKAAELVRQLQNRFAQAMELFEAGMDELFAFSAAAPDSDLVNQSAAAAKPGDSPAHASHRHLSAFRRLCADHRNAPGGEARRLADGRTKHI